MRGPSAGIRRRSPCNLPKSPCISLNCRERQVGFGLPAQPPSRGFSSSPPTFLNECETSGEIRHRMAVFPRKLTPERRSRSASARFLALYLYWAFCGVTLADRSDAGVMLPSNRMPSRSERSAASTRTGRSCSPPASCPELGHYPGPHPPGSSFAFTLLWARLFRMAS